MTRITDYTALAVAAAGDVLPIVDVSDTTMSAAGTTKNITISRLLGCVTVSPSGDTSGVTDAANLAAAIATFPSGFSGGGTVVMNSGTWYVASSSTVVIPAPVTVTASPGTFIYVKGSGDGFRFQNPTYGGGGCFGGGIIGFPVIDGSQASPGAVGVHLGDAEQARLDILVQNFAGAGSIGCHLDNQIWWTEKLKGTIIAINNTSNVVFDESGATTSVGSFGYLDLNIYVYSFGSTPGATQDGVVVQNGARPYNGKLVIKGNFQGSSSVLTSAVLRVTGQGPAGHPNAGNFSAIANCHLDIQVETSAAAHQPFTINFGGGTAQNTILGCYGIMDFTQGAGTFQACNLAVVSHAGTFGFSGMVLGDFNLQPANTLQHAGMTGVAQVWGQSFANASGVFVNDGDFFKFTLTTNTTISLNPGSTDCIPAPQRKTIIIVQAASGGPYTVTWPHTGSPSIASPTVNWAGGSAPSMSSGAGAVDVYKLETYDGATWFGEALQAMS